MEHDNPIDWDAILHSPMPLKASVGHGGSGVLNASPQALDGVVDLPQLCLLALWLISSSQPLICHAAYLTESPPPPPMSHPCPLPALASMVGALMAYYVQQSAKHETMVNISLCFIPLLKQRGLHGPKAPPPDVSCLCECTLSCMLAQYFSFSRTYTCTPAGNHSAFLLLLMHVRTYAHCPPCGSSTSPLYPQRPASMHHHAHTPSLLADHSVVAGPAVPHHHRQLCGQGGAEAEPCSERHRAGGRWPPTHCAWTAMRGRSGERACVCMCMCAAWA